MNRKVQLLNEMWEQLVRECNSVVTEETFDTFKCATKSLRVIDRIKEAR